MIFSIAIGVNLCNQIMSSFHWTKFNTDATVTAKLLKSQDGNLFFARVKTGLFGNDPS